MADSANGNAATTSTGKDQRGRERLPIKMLNDRILVDMDRQEGERRSTGGILTELVPVRAGLVETPRVHRST